MTHREERFDSADGLSLYQRIWLPRGDAVAVVVVLHGVIEHSGRYAALAEDLNRHGYAVYAMDLRGHGRSGGPPVLVRSFDQYLDDLQLLLGRVAAREPGKPLFVFGHSMGGLIATLLAATRTVEVNGLVLSAAALRVAPGVFPVLRHLAALVARVWPTLRLVRVDGARISRDPEVLEQFRGDPLVFHGRFPTCTGAEIFRAARQIQANMEAVRLPLLILHGTGDLITDPEGSRELYRRAASTDKTLRLYAGLYHDLVGEPEKDQVKADLFEWLSARR